MFLRKSPHSLPSSEYGGGRKRIFIGLMGASCLLLCLCLVVFLILPWSGFSLLDWWLPRISIAVGIFGIAVLSWLCLALVFHIYTGRAFPGVRSIRHLTIRLFYPLMELLAKLVGIERDKLRRSFIKVNNELLLADFRPVAPDRLLLLLPHCVQSSRCVHRLTHNVEHCRRCGSCPVGALLDLRDRYGFRFAIATGGTIARRIVVALKPDAIIAVACERDLISGIQDSYPLAVFGLLNERPHGPCMDTLVPLTRLEALLRLFLGLPEMEATDAA
ncbi:MAG: DUF116 domain-containing protein [Desulfovibrionaceae bacterium]|nr:DUF116 domain-containing protein [Desulfovibrionaceae bacterium]